MRFTAPWAFLLLPLLVLYWCVCRRGRRALVFSSVDLAGVNLRSVRQRFLGDTQNALIGGGRKLSRLAGHHQLRSS